MAKRSAKQKKRESARKKIKPLNKYQYSGVVGMERKTPRNAQEHPGAGARSAAVAKIMRDKSCVLRHDKIYRIQNFLDPQYGTFSPPRVCRNSCFVSSPGIRTGDLHGISKKAQV